jgi:hypothetical protein
MPPASIEHPRPGWNRVPGKVDTWAWWDGARFSTVAFRADDHWEYVPDENPHTKLTPRAGPDLPRRRGRNMALVLVAVGAALPPIGTFMVLGLALGQGFCEAGGGHDCKTSSSDFLFAAGLVVAGWALLIAAAIWWLISIRDQRAMRRSRRLTLSGLTCLAVSISGTLLWSTLPFSESVNGNAWALSHFVLGPAAALLLLLGIASKPLRE